MMVWFPTPYVSAFFEVTGFLFGVQVLGLPDAMQQAGSACYQFSCVTSSEGSVTSSLQSTTRPSQPCPLIRSSGDSLCDSHVVNAFGDAGCYCLSEHPYVSVCLVSALKVNQCGTFNMLNLIL